MSKVADSCSDVTTSRTSSADIKIRKRRYTIRRRRESTEQGAEDR